MQVVCLSEEDLIRCARLREFLQIPDPKGTGQTLESATRYRDKIIMKKLLAESGVCVPPNAPVESVMDVITFVKKYGPSVGMIS